MGPLRTQYCPVLREEARGWGMQWGQPPQSLCFLTLPGHHGRAAEVQITEEKPAAVVAHSLRWPRLSETPDSPGRNPRPPSIALTSSLPRLIITHTPLSSPHLPMLSLPKHFTTGESRLLPVTMLTFILSMSLFVNFFLSLVSCCLYLSFLSSVSVSLCDSAVCFCVYLSVCISPGG